VNTALAMSMDEPVEVVEQGAKTATTSHRRFAHVLTSWRAEIGVGTALLFLVAACSLLAPSFLSTRNLLAVLTQTSVIAIVAVGMTMVIIAGEIDLSVGSTVGLCGTVFAWLIAKAGAPIAVAFLVVMSIAVAVGAFTGMLRVCWGIPSFITTIGLLSVLRGLAFLLSNGLSITPMPNALAALWYGALIGIPVPIVIAAVVALAGWILLSQMRFGRHLYAVGGSAETASRYGIRVARLRVSVFIIVQLLAALGGVMLVARLDAGSASVGELLELDVIAAVIVGGTSLAGGTGRIIGTLLGVLFVAVLRNGMVLLGVDPIVFMVAQGTVIILAVWWSMLRRSVTREAQA